MRFLLATALAVAVLPGSAGAAETVAGFLTGEALLAQCAGGGADRCTDYIAGAADTLLLAYRYGNHIVDFRACIPPSVADRDVADVVIQSLLEHPERQSHAAVAAVARALTDAFYRATIWVRECVNQDEKL
jgi:hypothetical protein